MRIFLFAAAIYLLWLLVEGKYITGIGMCSVLKKLFTWENLAKLLIVNEVPEAYHLWYLAAMAECYCLLLAYRQFFAGEQVNYRPLYMLSFSMLALCTAGSAAMQCCGITVDEELFRNVWFFGMPMFSMGIFLQQYGERIVKNYRLTVKKGAAVIAAGALLSVLQFLAISKNELPIGMVPASAVLLLLTVSCPIQVREDNRRLNRLSDLAQSLSLTLYIVHVLPIIVLIGLRKTVPIAGTVWSWN